MDAACQVPRAAARRFNQVAWPAFGVLLLTGVALTGISALAALFPGILLAG